MYEDESSEEDGYETPPRKVLKTASSKKHTNIKQKYKKSWERHPEFMSWLGPDAKNVHGAYCRLCDRTLIKADLDSLKRHKTTNKHRKNEAAVARVRKLPEITGPQEPEIPKTDVLAKGAEIRLAAFFAEHNVPFHLSDHLTEVLKKCFPDSEIAQQILLKRTKMRSVVTNVLGKNHKHSLVSKLRSTVFSLIVDESTDITKFKHSCVVVRFFDSELGKISSEFFELTCVFSGNDYSKAQEGASARNLFDSIVEVLRKYKIPAENLIGFCSDTCSVMMGSNDSVATRLAELFVGITIWKCLCHSLHLCASKSCCELPERCERLARSIYAFFSHSAKRCAQYVQFQKIAEIPIHRILHPSQTRWLSLQQVVARLLEQWDALTSFFSEKLKEKVRDVEDIVKNLKDPCIKLYYLFLDWVLPKFTELNTKFQSESVVLPYVHESMVKLYKELLLMYMEPGYVGSTAVAQLNPSDTSKFLDHRVRYYGVKFLEQLRVGPSPDKDALHEFHLRTRNFLITACIEVRKRFDFGNQLTPLLTLLTKKSALDLSLRKFSPSLHPLMSLLPRIRPQDPEVAQRIDDEWRQLPFALLPSEITNCKDLEVDLFWGKLLIFSSGEDTPFATLSKFALEVLSLPHSNADCERIFSAVNLIKTQKRNKLLTETINGTLLAKQSIKYKGGCDKFDPNDALLSMMNSTNLYPAKEDQKAGEPMENEDEEPSDIFEVE